MMISQLIFNKFLSSTADKNDIKNDLHIERVEFLSAIDKFKFSIFPYLGGIAVFTALNFAPSNQTLQWIWLLTAIAFRFFLQFLYNKFYNFLQIENTDFTRIKFLLRLSAVIYGFSWGISVFFFFPLFSSIDSSSYSIFSVCMVAIISNYCLMTLPRVDLSLLFSFSVAIPACLRAGLEGLDNSIWIICGYAIFISAQTFYSMRMRNIYQEQVILKMQNQELVDSLEQNREKLNENIRLLEDLSLHDELTLLPNRRFLANKFLDFKLSAHQNDTFSLMMLDLDNFKQINDQYGHLIGDKVLIQVANVLKNNIRNSDCAARVGGEEFVILLPKVRGKEAFATAERIRKAIENQVFLDSNNKAFQVTASIGLTRSDITNDVFSALQSADEAVYDAKQSGKNCVKIASNIEFSFSPNITFTDSSEICVFLN